MTQLTAALCKRALAQFGSPERAVGVARFFKTGKGEYGEGDVFIGCTVPECRLVAKEFRALPLGEVEKLMMSRVHEERAVALFILVAQFERVPDKKIFQLYRKRMAYVNNWDLVDSSAPYILGDYLKTHSPNVLFRLAAAKSIWDRRIAIISTFAFIRDGQFDLTLKIAEMLLNDKEDLIHKATGWALREVGKKDHQALLNFLDHHAGSMPRTALRYAIERLSPEERRLYLSR